MTSRPNLGGSQPQRSLSANIIQRPPPRRTLSQQFTPVSPARRNNEGLVDQTLDGSEATLGRYGTIPRNGGSRLKLEISKDSTTPDFVESPNPTSAAAPTCRSSLLPRGRPQLHFDVPSVSNRSSRLAQEGGHNDIIIKPMPMPLPVRPGQHAPPAQEKVRVSSGNSAKKDARPKPFVLEVPPAAPRYYPSGRADFFPWTGDHPEDRLSETAIRQGYYDKAQMTQNETGSARPSILPPLKHKSALLTLSSLFTSVLAQRRARGQITSNSTFKPPPRVTVTDTKREIWLKDLANPAISLRRLSRSIPHGVRGKVLLDQALSKNIPVERAVWLAKCVGANELRSFRRKGAGGTFAMGGEARWVRDFTICVEQFVESIVGACGEKNFRSRINYAIRLAAHFYAEHLLDREHYMDWLVSILETSPQAKLPMWLLITQIYWKDILQYRKYGRRLSAALLAQLAEAINHPDSDILAPLVDRLKIFVKGLMASNPDSFIYPKIWTKHRVMMQSTLKKDEVHFRAILASIDRRNGQLAATEIKGAPSSRQRLIDCLDATLTTLYSSRLINQCWQIEEDKSILLRTILEWSTSVYRPGMAKIYIAARMLRYWSRFGADVTEAILTFLDSHVCERGRNKAALYHLISELARSKHFSTPIFLQWIIARGGLNDETDVAPNGPCATRLLAELPTHNVSETIIALRSALLSRVGFSVDEEEAQTRSYIVFLNSLLPGMQANTDLDFQPDQVIISPFPAPSELNQTSKSEIGLWLREKVKTQMLPPTMPSLKDWDDSPTKQGTSAITAFEFNIIRQQLEVLEDYSLLADVLKIVTSSNDVGVLASCADTLNLHSDIFAAIGALNDLFDVLMARLRLSGEDDVLPRALLVALSDLAGKIPEQKMIAQQLTSELARSDRKTAADACSPVSDHTAGLTQTAEADFTDEIEKVLASGNSMDQATLERLFHRIALRLESSWQKSPDQHRSCDLLLTRLRTFDTQQFDILMSAWVNRFFQIQNRPTIVQVLGPLISLGCLDLREVISSFESEIANTPTVSGQSIGSISGEMLALVFGSPCSSDTMTSEESYRLRIKQNQLQRDHHSTVLSVLRWAIEDLSPSDAVEPGNAAISTKNLFGSHEFFDLLQRLVLIDTDSTIRILISPLIQSARAGAASSISSIVDTLVAAERYMDAQREITIGMIFDLADEFNLPFCQVKLASMFSTNHAETVASKDDPSHRLEAFDHAIESAVVAEHNTWASILPLLDGSVAQHLRARAETQFVALFPSSNIIAEEASATQNRVERAETLFHIIEATAHSMTVPLPNVSLVSEIAKAFDNIWFLFANHQSLPQQTKQLLLTKWLPLLLSFTKIHIPSFDATKGGHDSRAKALLALVAIFLELQALETSTGAIIILIEQTFDLALELVDTLPDDFQQHCTRLLRHSTSNPRVSYLFSIAANPTDWLRLKQKQKATGPVGPDRTIATIEKEKLTPYPLKRWEMLGDPTPNVGENDTSLNLKLFGARRG